MDDQALLIGISEGDEVSYRELVNKYSRYVAAVCIRVAKGQLQKEDIEEVSADVFVKVWASQMEKFLSVGTSIEIRQKTLQR